jgi:hypothetical protein
VRARLDPGLLLAALLGCSAGAGAALGPAADG